MLLSIHKEREAIGAETKLLKRTMYKLGNQMRHFKEFNQLKIIIKNIVKYLTSLQTVEHATIADLPHLNMQKSLQQSTRVKNHLVRRGQQLKKMLEDTVFMSFAVLGMGFLARIKFNLDQIETKLKALERIVSQMRRKDRQRQ